jgi:ubiquinone/menaquinone biosynthesis C-methylase UbiE
MRDQNQAGGLIFDFYDLRIEGDYRPISGDVPFYLRQARKTGGPILELACGTGRIAIPLARAGFEVVGLDKSRAMLRIARAKAGGVRKLEWRHGYMTSLTSAAVFG